MQPFEPWSLALVLPVRATWHTARGQHSLTHCNLARQPGQGRAALAGETPSAQDKRVLRRRPAGQASQRDDGPDEKCPGGHLMHEEAPPSPSSTLTTMT